MLKRICFRNIYKMTIEQRKKLLGENENEENQN